MAAAATVNGREAPVRLRLCFDYPPPGSPACGLCWLLLEPGQVRLVTDLTSVIRERFGFSRRARLSLFLDGALLPPTESARLVRDNDSLRVRLEEVAGEDSYEKTTNGFTRLSKKERKRHRQKWETEESSNEDEEHRKRKKRKSTIKHLSSREENATNMQELNKLKKKENVVMANSTIDDNISHSNRLKKAEQEKVERAQKKPKASTVDTKTNKPLTLGHNQNCNAKNRKPPSNTNKGCETSNESSTSSSDSDQNTTDNKQKLSHKTKVAAPNPHKSQLESRTKSTPAGNLASEPKNRSSYKVPNVSKSASPSSSSDSDSSSGKEEEPQSSNLKKKLLHKNQGTGTSCSSKNKPNTSSSESDSSESDTNTVKKPKTNVAQSVADNADKRPNDISGPTTSHSSPARGRGRGENAFWRGPRVRGCRGMIRGRGRGREGTNFFYNYNSERQKQQQLNEAATNTSVIIQNSPEPPKKDYNALPLLAAPPQVGEKIAFKLLELTENYTPEVSDYKEGKIVSWNPVNKQLELELLSFSSVAKEPGKFDLVYQSADGAETIEYAVSQERKITETWDALIDPRLIVNPPNIESNTENGNL